MSSTSKAQAPVDTGTATAATTDLGTQSAAPPYKPAAPVMGIPAENLNKAVQDERNADVTAARNGQYDAALTSLAKLHEKYAKDDGITRDYLAVLSWASHDEEAVRLYETLPAQQPDYVLSAVGHSYRILKQSEKALAAYKLGAQQYPDSVIFVDGEIRSLMDLDRLDDAAKLADDDLHTHGNRAEIVAAKADVVQMQIKEVHDKAVQLGRDKNYTESLALFRGDLLDAEHTTDASIRQDYLAVLSWAGGHDAEVIAIYQSLKDQEQPDYVLAATAKAYRNQHHPDQALLLYREGVKHYPDSELFQMGEIHALLDLDRADEALTKIKTYEKAHGPSPELDSAKRDIEQIRFNAVRRKAANLARKGQFERALAILRKLGGEHTKNMGIRQDRLAIYGWMGGHDQDVIDQYLAFKNPNQPDYVMEAVGKAYRDLGKTDKALAIYEHGMRRYPKNEEFVVGTIRCLTDQGYIEKALAVADDDIRRHGNRLDVLIAAGDAANQYNQTDAVRYYQAAAKIAPKNPDVIRGLIRTSDRMGAPDVALRTIHENPGLISDAERRQIEGDQLAAEVRLGSLDQPDDENRYAATDKAIADIDAKIAAWQEEGAETEPNITRARFDRIIALHNRSRMKDVISEYNGAVATGAEPPVFVLGAVGDAYMDEHEPEKARDIYMRLLQVEPKNQLARRQLFYAYVDMGDYKSAYRIADEMVSDGTIWNRQKNEDMPMTPAERRDADLTAGAARLYFGEVTEADKRILPVVNEAEDSPETREAMGNLANAHQWPNAALEQYQIGTELAGGKNISNEVGIANTNLELHNYRSAETEVNSLMERYPDNNSVLRAKRDWDVHNMAEFDLNAGYFFEPMTERDVNGGQAYGIEGKIYSQPFAYNWRIFAGEAFTNQKEPDNEGSVGVSRSTVGVEYRNAGITANLAPTYNTFHGTERVGGEADVSDMLNDHWTVAGFGEIMSRDTPLRALNQGTTASEVGAHAVWQEDEKRSVRFGANIMPFSDGNFRSGENADFTQRVWTYPYWKIDAIASAGADQNSKDENRPYYNPKSDLIGLIGARAIETLYQRYTTMWQHSLQVMPGAYWQQNYGTDPTVRVRYEHRVFFDETFEAGLGVNFQRQDYDGAAENDVSLTLDVVDHF